MKKIFTLSILSLNILLAATAWASTKITNIRTSVTPAKVRLVLDATAPLNYQEKYANKTLILDLPQETGKNFKPQVQDQLVQSVAFQKLKKDSRLTVKLSKDCHYQIFKLSNPARLVIDFQKIVISRQNKKIAEGVEYSYLQDELQGLPVRAYLVTVSPSAAWEWRPFSAAGTYNGRGSVREQAKALNLLAAVNASYFDTDGWVVGTTKNYGQIMSMEATPHSALVVKDGKARIVKDVAYTGTARLSNGKYLEVTGMNRARIANDLVVYNEFYAPSTKTNMYGKEVKVRLSNNQIIAVSQTGNMSIEPGTIVLSGHGTGAAALAPCKVGDQLVFQETLNNSEADAAATVVGAGPMLLENGTVNVRTKEENIAADIAWGRAPRTAVGVKSDGTTLVLVVDGRSFLSAGMTLQELAAYLLKLGARDAVNFDGGGSSEMCIKGQLVNRPSDGSERPVSIGLGLFRKE